jgi:hypothetical protein
MRTMTLARGSLITVMAAAAGLHGMPSSHAGPPRCGPVPVVPIVGVEPPPRLVVAAPLPGPLVSRGVVVIPYCAEHVRLLPVFGAGALDASPRIGHVHVTVDDAAWHWADASGTPVILRGLPAGVHTVRIDLLDTNHGQLDTKTVSFAVPAAAAERGAHP